MELKFVSVVGNNNISTIKIFCLISIILRGFLIKAQVVDCNIINNNLVLLNDSLYNTIFSKSNTTNIFLVGELHGSENSKIYHKLLEKAVLNDYKTVLIEQPVSYTFLYEQLLYCDKFDKITSDLILKYVPNKKDFKKTLEKLHQINKTEKIKIVCTDIEFSLSMAIDRILDILTIHEKELNENYRLLFEKLKKSSKRKVLYESDCAVLFKEIIHNESIGLYMDDKCLKEHYQLFKSILKAAALNGVYTGEQFSMESRENFIFNFINDYFYKEKISKCIGFFGSSHVQLIGDSVIGHFIKNPLAKQLNESELFKNKVSTMLLSYRYEIEFFKYYQKYLFENYFICFDVLAYKSIQYLYKINENSTLTRKLRNYTFILYL